MKSNKELTPLQSIRAYCRECAFTCKEVRNCPVSTCALWIFRMGKNPHRKGVGAPSNEAERENLRRRAEHARNAR